MNRAAIAVAVVVSSMCCTSLSWAKECWTKTPEGIRQEVPCDESAKWVSDEVAPGKGHQQDWETGAVKAKSLPVQTWDKETGGTEIADKIKWAQEHSPKPPAPIQVTADAGKKP